MINNLTDTKLKKAIIIFISILLLNMIISLTTGHNLIAKAYNYLTELFTGYNKEITKIEITSLNYDTEPGSYKLTKEAKWTNKYNSEVTLTLESISKYQSQNKDIILLLDTSNDLCNNYFKEPFHNIINKFIKSNNISIITFTNEATINTQFTNNYDLIQTNLNNITCTNTKDKNYYKALLKSEDILKNMDITKEIQLILITDGYSNIDNPNEIGEYNILKSKYPNITLDLITYNLKITNLTYINKISDNYYDTNEDTLINKLNEIIIKPSTYTKFTIKEYLNDNYFTYIDSTSSKGNITLINENNKPVLIWTLDNEYISGNKETLTYYIEVSNNQKDKTGYFPITTNTNILSKLDNEDIYEQNNQDTLILKAGYEVIIDSNLPSSCQDNYQNKLIYYKGDTVEIPQDEPICNGYQFKGWKIVEEVDNKHDNYFIMPNYNVTIRGTWTKLNITKSMEGKIYEVPSLYTKMGENAVLDNIKSTYVTKDTGIDYKYLSSTTNGQGVYILSSTIDNRYPTLFYRGKVTNNNVLFANFCWKMMNTTSTGGVKLIYNGLPNNGTCQNSGTNTELSTKSKYSQTAGAPGALGYMTSNTTRYGIKSQSVITGDIVYGNDIKYEDGKYILLDTITRNGWSANYSEISTRYHYTCWGADSCETVSFMYYNNASCSYYMDITGGDNNISFINKIFFNSTNETDSTIKETIDNWYKTNMLDYESYLEDAVWCNDRRIAAYGEWDKDHAVNGSGFALQGSRNLTNGVIDLTCHINDSFTTNSESGNGKLKYKVGTITTVDYTLAGGMVANNNTTFYLYSGSNYWTMTPASFQNSFTSPYYISNTGKLVSTSNTTSYGVRPTISIKYGIDATSGDGTPTNPYVIN